MMQKARTPDEVLILDQLLTERDHETRLHIIIETNAGLEAALDVIDVPYLDLDDLDGMRHAAEQVLEIGFAGKGAVHPKQIAAVNSVFTTSDEQIARARRVISEFEKADTGLVVIDGKLIEKPVFRDMHRFVAIAAAYSGQSGQ